MAATHLPEVDLRNALPKLEGAERLAEGVRLGADVHEHQHLGLPRQAVLQQLRQLAVPEGHVARLLGRQRTHHVAQRAQRLVDVAGLHQALACSPPGGARQ
jgi:hypothetical protein